MKTRISKDQLLPEQLEGVEKLQRFRESSERIFILSGKAGTGKTTILNFAFQDLIEKDERMLTNTKNDERSGSFTICGVAMAHKAKNNLRFQGGIPYVNTFASAYGHKEYYNKRNGVRTFVPDPKKLPSSDCKKPFKVFVIDEVSMFNRKMLQLVLKETSMFAKIIFLGDRGQLPPILEGDGVDRGQDSPVWDLNVPDFCRHNLTQRVRQTDDNPIVEMSDVIYDEIFSENMNLQNVLDYISEDRLLSNGQGFCQLDEVDVYDMYKCSSDDYMDTKIIAYTNRTINAFNKYMRDHIHGYPKEQFIKNEIIYMNSTYYGKDREVGTDFCFYNSSEYIIKDVDHGEIDGIKVLYAELESRKWMPIVLGGKGHWNYQIYEDRLQEFADVKDWKGYWAFKDSFGNFSYGYALTAYKAQGSTYKNIFVGLDDILRLPVLSDKRKLQTLYTAVTRASHNVYFLTNN